MVPKVKFRNRGHSKPRNFILGTTQLLHPLPLESLKIEFEQKLVLKFVSRIRHFVFIRLELFPRLESHSRNKDPLFVGNLLMVSNNFR